MWIWIYYTTKGWKELEPVKEMQQKTSKILLLSFFPSNVCVGFLRKNTEAGFKFLGPEKVKVRENSQSYFFYMSVVLLFICFYTQINKVQL